MTADKNFDLVEYAKLSLWKYLSFLRPSWLHISGRFIINRYSRLSVSGACKLSVDGDLDICSSQLILNNSTVEAGSMVLNTTHINVEKSSLLSGVKTHFRSSIIHLQNTELAAGDHFRIHGSEIKLRETKFDAGNNFLCESKFHHQASIEAIKSNIRIGDNCRMQSTTNIINAKFTLGSNAFINYGTRISCTKSVTIGNFVMISYDCIIIDNNSHQLDHLQRRKEIENGFPNGTLQKKEQLPVSEPVTIGDDVWIGTRCMILKGVNIGNMAVVAASTTVTKNVPEKNIVFGNPNVYKPIEKPAGEK